MPLTMLLGCFYRLLPKTTRGWSIGTYRTTTVCPPGDRPPALSRAGRACAQGERMERPVTRSRFGKSMMVGANDAGAGDRRASSGQRFGAGPGRGKGASPLKARRSGLAERAVRCGSCGQSGVKRRGPTAGVVPVSWQAAGPGGRPAVAPPCPHHGRRASSRRSRRKPR